MAYLDILSADLQHSDVATSLECGMDYVCEACLRVLENGDVQSYIKISDVIFGIRGHGVMAVAVLHFTLAALRVMQYRGVVVEVDKGIVRHYQLAAAAG
jgi:hypothetical protein